MRTSAAAAPTFRSAWYRSPSVGVGGAGPHWHGRFTGNEEGARPEFDTKRKERAYGVYRARVTDQDDPEGGACVKVQPAEAALAEAWARVATAQLPAQGGGGYRHEGGDPREPYVVGSLWSEAGEPPTASRVTLRDTNGNAITLEPAGVTIIASAKISLAGGIAEVSVGGLPCPLACHASAASCKRIPSSRSVVASSYTPGAGNIW